jgi:hypothetical protein
MLDARTLLARRTLPALAGLAACLASGACAHKARAAAPASPAPEALASAPAVLSNANPLLEPPVYDRPVSQLTLAEIAAELESMAALDHRMLEAHFASADADRAIQAIDRAHAARLRDIVDAIGWPTRELVGDRAAQGAFLVVQHAGFDPDFQTSCLELMHDLCDQGRLPAPYVALLTDRVRMYRGQHQLFGTQMTFLVDELGLARAVPSIPVEDPANLDNRRAMMGMPSHTQFTRSLENAFADARVGSLPAAGLYAAAPTAAD